MGKFIAKIDGKYLEWSTVVDAPVTYGMTLEEFEDYYRQQYGEQGMRGLPDRLARVETKGSSAHPTAWDDGSLESLIACNRAGPDETELTLEEIAAAYCRDVPESV